MASLNLTEFVRRPAPGTLGHPVNIRTNFFEIQTLPNTNIYHYDVTITPDVPPIVNRRVYTQLIATHGDSDLGGRPVFDGRKNIFSARAFPFDAKSFDIMLPEDILPKGVVTKHPPRGFKVKIKKAADINLEELRLALNSKAAMSNNCLTAIMALDVLIHHKPAMLYSTVGRSFYTPDGAYELYGGLEVWNGFYQSARPASGRMLINLDVAATAYFQSGPLVDLVVKILDRRSIDDLRRGINDRERNKLEKALRGVQFRVTHRAQLRRSFKIMKLTPTPASHTMFEKENSKTDVATYFQETYGKRLLYPFLPCVVTGRDIFLPMELCSVIQGQRYPKKLNERQTADMIKFTCQPPHVRANKIRDGLKILSYRNNEYLKDFGVSVATEMANIPNKNPPVIYANPQGDIEKSLKEAWFRAGNAVKSQPQLMLCVLPTKGVPLYAEIKRVSDTVIGVATQCIQMSHTRQPKKQYCANVCLKMNVKLGGMNAFLSPDQTPFLTDMPTILFGADVSHPKPGDTTRPSIASLVGSMDSKAARYAATIRVQTARTETIADLGGMVVELLKTFYQTCGQKPSRILFYRDGVSDGQFAEVLRSEVASVKQACVTLDANYKPTISFVVVQKRHHARFFPMRREEGDRTGNCFPGTVVDSGITHPFEFDFFLQSHAGLQGTSRPTHYHVLYDENKFTADKLQDFTYRLCHLFARCTRTVSVVPPAYYAHLVAARARFHSRGENWTDTESSEAGGDESTYLAVKPDLLRVMYFM
ncbi:Eukaryotic translation initiation factor 2C [Lunasporangiospora selenospora]|uniref:Eukaryotic translation initiation factor 2C n=1 Tax=Lunasporangiospora selenospora TaxID=979761 RepID=A0A9P6FV12_9FUNG|nr:Eukaryotic translation initiation factor 2C [Lunasporangiospora selenospora]